MSGYYTPGSRATSGGSLPSGGAAGQVLEKLSGADGDAGWIDAIDPSDNATVNGLWNFTQTPEINGVPIGAASTALGTGLYVPATTASGYILSSEQRDGTGFSNIPKGQTNIVPIRPSRNVIGKIGFYVNAAGSSDCVVYGALWNAHATLDKPGTLIDTFNVANPGAASVNGSTVNVTLAADTTYWFGCWCTGTTAPTSVGIRNVKLAAQGWTDNNKWGTVSLRYTVITSPGDLTSTSPATGDIGTVVVPAMLLTVA